MTARILVFPNRSNPTDDDMAVLIKASLLLLKRRRNNDEISAILTSCKT